MDSKDNNNNESKICNDDILAIDDTPEIKEASKEYIEHNILDYKPKKVTASKIILYASALNAILLTLYVMIYCWITKDGSPMAYLIPSVFADSTAVIACVTEKSKKENQIKLDYIYKHYIGKKEMNNNENQLGKEVNK